MNVKEIVKKWLTDHRYDGLYPPDPDMECGGCFLCDLFPCDEFLPECQPGVKQMGDDGDYIIVPREEP